MYLQISRNRADNPMNWALWRSGPRRSSIRPILGWFQGFCCFSPEIFFLIIFYFFRSPNSRIVEETFLSVLFFIVTIQGLVLSTPPPPPPSSIHCCVILLFSTKKGHVFRKARDTRQAALPPQLRLADIGVSGEVGAPLRHEQKKWSWIRDGISHRISRRCTGW